MRLFMTSLLMLELFNWRKQRWLRPIGYQVWCVERYFPGFVLFPLLHIQKELLRLGTHLLGALVFFVVYRFLQSLYLLDLLVLDLKSIAQRTIWLLPVVKHVLVGLTHFLLYSWLQTLSAFLLLLFKLTLSS